MQIIPPEKGYPEFARFRTPLVRRLLAIAIWVGMTSFFLSLGWITYLSQVSPASPDAATGQVVELNNHGRFYVRAVDALAFNLGCLGGWALAFFGLIAGTSVFGQDQGESREFRYIGVTVVALALALVGIETLSNGRFPFNMASQP